MVQGKVRRDRIHGTGLSNRPRGEWNPVSSLTSQVPGPTNFDATTRSQMARDLQFDFDMKVPITNMNQLNRDFSHTIPGRDFREPGTGGPTGTRERPVIEHPLPLSHVNRVAYTKKEELRQTQTKGLPGLTEGVETIKAPDTEDPKAKTRAFVAAARYDPKLWWRDAEYYRDPPNKVDGEPWNHMDNQKRGRIKGQDRLMRTCPRPSQCGSPRPDTEEIPDEIPEYWPGRDTADQVEEAPFNDFQVRPVHLPDMFTEPGALTHDQKVHRMKRLREYLRQRYGGRPTLLTAFRNLSLEKPGYIVAADLQLVFDQMGMKIDRSECQMLIESVDKDYKGAVSFDEFANLVYAPDVEIGGPPTQAQERHVRHVTRDVLLGLASRFPKLQRYFLEVDPERRHIINKEQFQSAISSCMNQITHEAVDFLWAANFEQAGKDGFDGTGPPAEYDAACIDWRGFMQHIANFAHMHRPPTPVCVRSRKNKKDQVMRTVALTGGELPGLDWPGPEQEGDDEVKIVADHIVHTEKELRDRPQECYNRTYNYIEVIREKGIRGHRMLAKRVPKVDLENALAGRTRCNRDELVDIIMGLVRDPQEDASTVTGSVESWDPAELGPLEPKQAPKRQVLKADVQALVNTEFVDRDDDVDVQDFVEHVYEWKSKLAEVNDGANPALRGLRPKRQRPERGRYDNYWRARMIMETVSDALEPHETGMGGKLQNSKLFKRLDLDRDGYVSLEDLQHAFRKYKVQGDLEDVHALMTALDPQNKGSVDMGEFTRHFVTYQGNLLDGMSRPIEGVHEYGGVFVGGPSNKDVPPGFTVRSDEQSARSQLGPKSERSQQSRAAEERSARAASQPPALDAAEPRTQQLDGPLSPQRSASQSSVRTRSSAIDRLFTERPMRITDVIKQRTDEWKPKWTDLYMDGSRPGRFSWTLYPDTRHVTEPLDPRSGSFLPPEQRFITTQAAASMFSVPEHQLPQTAEAMKKNTVRDFRIERIRKRQMDMAERREVAEMAAKEFDERRLARKALTLLEYERRVPISAC